MADDQQRARGEHVDGAPNDRVEIGAAGLVKGSEGSGASRGDVEPDLEGGRDCLLTLPSIAYRRPMSPNVLHHVEAAADHWHRGEKALATIRLTFGGLHRLDDPALDDRVRLARWLLDEGMSPGRLRAELGLGSAPIDIRKYDPDQPRVPAGNGRESGRWKRIWDAIDSWLHDPVPVYDPDTGIRYGTQSRGRAIATNPVTVGTTGAAVLLGGEAVVGAMTAPTTIAQALRTLPVGMSRVTFGKLAGFVQGQTASGEASTEATAEIISNLRSAGVNRRCVHAFQRFYAGVANGPATNLAAIHRAELLKNIGRILK